LKFGFETAINKETGETSVVSTRIWKPSLILSEYQYRVGGKTSKLGWVCVKERYGNCKRKAEKNFGLRSG
jgi:hypothetical protein